MKNKEFDCVELQRKIRDEFWIESGESIDSLIELHNKRIKENSLINVLLDNNNLKTEELQIH